MKENRSQLMNLISVIDCETTGLNARHSDRIVEIAVVVIDTNGKAVREFVSLVNQIGRAHV